MSGNAAQYAQAVVQAMVERWQATLGQAQSALDSDSSLAALVNDGSKSVEERSSALVDAISSDVSAEIENLLRLVIQDNHVDMLGDISAAIAEVATGKKGPAKAEVVSAVELSDEEQARLRESLAEQHGNELVFSFRVDPSLLGGLRVRVGDRLTDTSVASRLAVLRESLSSAVR